MEPPAVANSFDAANLAATLNEVELQVMVEKWQERDARQLADATAAALHATTLQRAANGTSTEHRSAASRVANDRLDASLQGR